MKEKVILDLRTVLDVIGKSAFYNAVPAFRDLRPRVWDTYSALKRAGLIREDGKGAGCSSCRAKKLGGAYSELFKQFMKVYSDLWNNDREKLLPLKNFLGAEKVVMFAENTEIMEI